VKVTAVSISAAKSAAASFGHGVVDGAKPVGGARVGSARFYQAEKTNGSGDGVEHSMQAKRLI